MELHRVTKRIHRAAQSPPSLHPSFTKRMSKKATEDEKDTENHRENPEYYENIQKDL